MMSRPAPGADFTSALFLAQRHPQGELRPWTQFTLGVPAALREPEEAGTLATLVARSQHAPAGLVARSALHGLVDILQSLPEPADRVLLDSGVYPLARQACRAAGVQASAYPHHRPPEGPLRARTWILTDGWCQGCGQPAPLARLQQLATGSGGKVIVDDSLAYGVLGRRRGPDEFGDGTGTVRWTGLEHAGFIWLASLAKAHGTPLTVITGERGCIQAIARRGSHRMHSSPPSAADLVAGLDALAQRERLDMLRGELERHTLWLRGAYTELGLCPQGQPFPIVGTRLASVAEARRWQQDLARRGLKVLIQQPRCHRAPVLSAVLRADHHLSDLQHLVQALAEVSGRRKKAA